MHFRSLFERTRRRKPHAHPIPRPERRSSLQPALDVTLPFWVATDRQVWATTDDAGDAIDFAERLVAVLEYGERVTVTMGGLVIWTGHGERTPGKAW